MHRVGRFAVVLVCFLAFASGARAADSPLGWEVMGEPGCGGAMVDISVSPHESRRLLVSGDMLGIGLSEDGGDSWQATFGLRSWECGSFTWHPTKRNTVWVGMACGPYVSHDGGRNWIEKRSGMPPLRAFGHAAPIEKVIFDRKDPKRLIAIAGSRRHWDLGPDPQHGAVWESLDAGESWKKLGVLTRGGFSTEAGAKGVNFWYADFAAGSDSVMLGQADGVGIVRSRDAGRTWQIVQTKGLPTNDCAIALHPKDPSVLWAGTNSYRTGKDDSTREAGSVYRSVDGGLSWADSGQGFIKINLHQHDWLTSRYSMPVVCPSNPDILYVCDMAWNRGIVYRSEDGGKSWRPCVGKANVEQDNSHVGKAPMFVVKTTMFAGCSMGYGTIDPKDPNVAYLVNSEFILRTRDGGKTWDDATAVLVKEEGGVRYWRGRGYSGWCARNFRFNPYRKGQSMLQGMDASRAWLSHDSLGSWQYCLTEPNPWFGGHETSFSKDGHIFVTCGQGGFWGIGRSADGGKTWDLLHGERRGLPKLTMGGAAEPGGIHVHPDDPKRVWAIVDRKLAASGDGGETWISSRPGEGLNWIQPDIKEPGHFYISGDKNVLETRDAGKTFVRIGGPKPASRMALDSLGRLYVVAHEGNRGGLYRYADGKWTRLRDDRWIKDVAVDPTDADRLMLCTNQNPYADVPLSTGVWISDDAGKSWSQANEGLPMTRGACVAFDPFSPAQVVYGSMGRGFFKGLWPRSHTATGTSSYTSNADDATFCAIDESDAQARRLILRNGSMTEGDVVPTGWAGKWGDVTTSRDTKEFKGGPASLCVECADAKKGGQGFQRLECTGGTRIRISGWMKTAGKAKVNVAVQAFDDRFSQNKFEQAKFAQDEMVWTYFEKEIVVPEWATQFNVLLLVEGKGKAWLDEVKVEQMDADGKR